MNHFGDGFELTSSNLPLKNLELKINAPLQLLPRLLLIIRPNLLQPFLHSLLQLLLGLLSLFKASHLLLKLTEYGLG